jgi:acetyl-CoA acetyltransferase
MGDRGPDPSEQEEEGAMPTTRNPVCFVGCGYTTADRTPQKSEAEYVIEACRHAAEDAGIDPADIDGINIQPHHLKWDISPVVQALGIRELRWEQWGGGGPQSASLAAMAIDAGVCNTVVVCKVMNTVSFVTPAGVRAWDQFEDAYGLAFERERCGLYKRRYMHRYGITDEQVGWVPIVSREHAQLNPYAYWQGKGSLTLDEYLSSRWIADPIRILDCDMPVNVARAYVMTGEDKAKSLRHPPAYMIGWAISPPCEHPGGCQHMMMEETEYLAPFARQLWRDTGLNPKQISTAQLCDGFSHFPLMYMEQLGLVGRGEAGPFVEGGDRIRIGGELPMNTAGGNLGEGRVHFSGVILESIQQVRGTAGARQVADCEFAVFTMPMPLHGTGCVVGKEPPHRVRDSALW